jgi:hypothetical protein
MTDLTMDPGIGGRLSAGSMPLPAGAGPAAWMPGVGTAERFSLKPFWVPILVLALRFAPGGINHLAYLFLFCYAFAGRRQAILSLYLLCLCNVATHAFGGPPGLAAIYRHLITFAAAASMMVVHVGGQPRSCATGAIAATAGLCTLLFGHSLTLSENSPVSLLKVFSFTLVILTLLIGWSKLNQRDRALLERQIWGTLIGLTVLGFPLAFTGYGYVTTKIGFQGLLSHSQTLGPVMGVLAVFLLMTWMTMRRFSWLTVVVMLLALASVYFSAARIGALVVVAGMTAGMLSGIAIRFRNAPRVLKRRLVLVATAAVMVLIVAGPRIAAIVQDFVAKGDVQDYGQPGVSLSEEAMQSRGFLIEAMMRNIERKPLTGIGFGVAMEGGSSGRIERDPIFGLPIMATVEKGVMPIALVEELGIPFASLFALWFLMLFVMAARGGAVNLALFTAALTTNVAEACFFSPGGMGLFFLVVITMAATGGPAAARDRRLLQQRYEPPLPLAA